MDASLDVRPNVVVSRCLGFAAVRYNAKVLESPAVAELRGRVNFIPVCPEVGIGLGVPREPIRLVETGEGLRLLQPATGTDLTEEMKAFSAGIEQRGPVDGFILKSRSPSCGPGNTKIFDSEEGRDPVGVGSGRFAASISVAFPWAALQDEERLADAFVRDRFLEHVRALARLRASETQECVDALTRFHEAHQALLRDLDPAAVRRLDRIVERGGSPSARGSSPEPFSSYRTELGSALRAAWG